MKTHKQTLHNTKNPLEKVETARYLFLCFFIHLMLMVSGMGTLLAESPSKYLVPVGIPDYDSTNPRHFLITPSNNGWSRINNASYRYFYVEPGNYQSLGRITITQSGSQNKPRYVSLHNGNDIHPGKLPKSQQARVLMDFDGVSHWVVDRLSTIDRPHDLAIRVLPVSHDIVFNRLYMHNFKKCFTIFGNNSNVNFTRDITIQKCRFDSMSFKGIDNDNVAILLHGTDWDGFRRVQNVHVLDCEIVNCNDGLMPLKWSNTNVPDQVVDYQGLVIDGNHIYVDNRVYTDGEGNLDPTGDYALTENAIDLKGGSENPDNPMVITNNYFGGFRRTDQNGGGSGSWGSAIVIHFGVWNVVIKGNVFFNSARGLSMGAKRKEAYSGKNITILGNTFESIGDYWTISNRPVMSYFYESKNLTSCNNVFVASDGQAKWLNLSGTEEDMEVADNVVIGNLVLGGSRSLTTKIYGNWFYGNTPQRSSDGITYPSAADANMQNLIFTTDRYTNNPRTITIPGILTTEQSPHYENMTPSSYIRELKE